MTRVGQGGEYLGHAQQQLQVHQELIDMPAEHGQLSPAHLEPLLWVRGRDHAPLPSSQEPAAGYFHIEGQATNVGKQLQAKGLAKDPVGIGREEQDVRLTPSHAAAGPTTQRTPQCVRCVCKRVLMETQTEPAFC